MYPLSIHIAVLRAQQGGGAHSDAPGRENLHYYLSNSNRNRAQSTIHSYQHTNQTISFHKLKKKENIRLRKQLSISAVKGYFFYQVMIWIIFGLELKSAIVYNQKYFFFKIKN